MYIFWLRLVVGDLFISYLDKTLNNNKYTFDN